MRQLVPELVDDVDPVAVFTAAPRPRPTGRPWLLVDMVQSADGATALRGRARGLGGPGDHRVFHALREVADTVLVGAETARAENYGPVRSTNGARIAVVTATANLDPAARLFTEALPSGEPAPPVLVLVPAAAPAERVDALRAVAEVVTVGVERVDPVGAVAALGERGAEVVLCEGGPTLNGQLVEADLVDEWCITYAPRLVGGPAKRASVGDLAVASPVELRLAGLLEEDGELYARYLRADAPG